MMVADAEATTFQKKADQKLTSKEFTTLCQGRKKER